MGKRVNSALKAKAEKILRYFAPMTSDGRNDLTCHRERVSMRAHLALSSAEIDQLVKRGALEPLKNHGEDSHRAVFKRDALEALAGKTLVELGQSPAEGQGRA